MSIGKDFLSRNFLEESIFWRQGRKGAKSILFDSELDWRELRVEVSQVIKAAEDGAESQRMTRHALSELFDELSSDLSKASSLLSVGMSSVDAPTIFKLLYVHVVNLIESLLSSILCRAIEGNQGLVGGFERFFLENGFSSGSDENWRKILSRKGLDSRGVCGSSFKNFSDIEFLFVRIFGEQFRSLNFTAIGSVFSRRDDLLVRYGKNIEGQPVQFTAEEVELVIATLRDFAVDLNISIYHSLFGDR
ncbi:MULTISPECIES: hypothetical protein [Pseudomonas]|uniref:RiboL-PSP-HEPN domain-containing protein n=1 Tax=Pseudomonas monteilii TaxID=76759 RepID=A0A7X3F6Q2_9PSED|nr:MULTISPECIES: hypothetical protein [Pseudomonas]MBA6136050.1 hypothetical protein [Pseudomonas monteilii]MCA4078571.1 hypothetical protein [Pseudomonas kurunegalensis]MDT3748402.1 hypothetical protein [Pseudomonas kurunegalensis]MVF52316.1 hypothetical protein [Pseudomonas monteilii]